MQNQRATPWCAGAYQGPRLREAASHGRAAPHERDRRWFKGKDLNPGFADGVWRPRTPARRSGWIEVARTFVTSGRAQGALLRSARPGDKPADAKDSPSNAATRRRADGGTLKTGRVPELHRSGHEGRDGANLDRIQIVKAGSMQGEPQDGLRRRLVRRSQARQGGRSRRWATPWTGRRPLHNTMATELTGTGPTRSSIRSRALCYGPRCRQSPTCGEHHDAGARGRRCAKAPATVQSGRGAQRAGTRRRITPLGARAAFDANADSVKLAAVPARLPLRRGKPAVQATPRRPLEANRRSAVRNGRPGATARGKARGRRYYATGRRRRARERETAVPKDGSVLARSSTPRPDSARERCPGAGREPGAR